jgi:indoleamine 2,3-dioxygenase
MVLFIVQIMSDLKDFDISLRTGFAPEHVSDKLPGDYFASWEEAARSLPQWTQEMRIREGIDALPDREFTTATLGTDEADWRWAYVVVSFLAQAYISEDTNRGLVQRLPPKLSIPWQVTSTHIGVLPAATYAAIALYNYVLKDPSKPIAPENLQAALTFTGTSQESWFFMVHILEEAEAAPGLQAIISGYKAMASNDNKSLVTCLETITQSLRNMKSILKKMYERCDPSFFYNKIRPFLSFPEGGLIYSGVSSEVQQYCSVSGAQDTAVPAFSIFLGARHEPSEQQLVDKFKLYMPSKHRKFLQFLSEQTSSLSEYVKESGDTELLQKYDEAVDALVSFRTGHISLVTSYIINVKRRQGEGVSETDRGTGGTPFMAFLKKVRDNTNRIKSTQS